MVILFLLAITGCPCCETVRSSNKTVHKTLEPDLHERKAEKFVANSSTDDVIEIVKVEYEHFGPRTWIVLHESGREEILHVNLNANEGFQHDIDLSREDGDGLHTRTKIAAVEEVLVVGTDEVVLFLFYKGAGVRRLRATKVLRGVVDYFPFSSRELNMNEIDFDSLKTVTVYLTTSLNHLRARNQATIQKHIGADSITEVIEVQNEVSNETSKIVVFQSGRAQKLVFDRASQEIMETVYNLTFTHDPNNRSVDISHFYDLDELEDDIVQIFPFFDPKLKTKIYVIFYKRQKIPVQLRCWKKARTYLTFSRPGENDSTKDLYEDPESDEEYDQELQKEDIPDLELVQYITSKYRLPKARAEIVFYQGFAEMIVKVLINTGNPYLPHL